MEPCDLSYIAGQCDSILGDVPSRREKRDILLALLLLAWLSVSPAGGPSEGEGAGERAAQGPYSRGPRPSLGRMWEDCLSSEEQTVGHSLASLASSAAGRIPDLRPLLPADSVWERIPGRQLKQLLPLLDRALRGEGEARGAAALWEAIVARYPGETSPGTGRFYAPAEVVGLLTALLRPEGGTVYDPCCGSGNMLLRFAAPLPGRGADVQLYGREADEDAWRMAKFQLLFRGVSADLGPAPSYAPAEDGAERLKADYVISHPPFNDRSWQDDYETLQHRPFLRYGAPPRNRSSLAWLQFMLQALKPGGKLAVLLNVSPLDSSFASEKRIREGLVRDGLLTAVMLLPAGLFWGTEVPVALLVLQNGGKSRLCGDRILMVDGSSLGTRDGKKLRLTRQDRQAILAVWDAYQRGESPEQTGFCATVSPADVEAREGTLYPRTYIPYEKAPLPGWEALLERESALLAELQGQLRDSEALVRRICRGGQEE